MRTPLFLILYLCSLGAAEVPPNFVVILGEAQGWASLSIPLDDRNVAGSRSDYIQTPNLDSIGKSGVSFSDFYAAAPRCTPSRAALYTGRSPTQLRMTFVSEGKKDGVLNSGDKVIAPACTTELPAAIETMATLLRKRGYATAHFGKWHLGRVNPTEHGFDESDGANSNGGPDEVENPNPKQCLLTAQKGCDFIARQVKAKKPFYLEIDQYPGRQGESATPETIAAVKKRLGENFNSQNLNRAAGCEEIDKSIGQVLAQLKALGVSSNTYIIYTADHGAQGANSNGILTNGKGTIWEGGVRVPLLISGPEIKAGTFSHLRASHVDLLPTVAELAGLASASLPNGIEGVSLVSVLKGKSTELLPRARDDFVIHYPHYDKDELGPTSAIYYKNYKLIRVYETSQSLLFDLNTDIGEKKNLAATLPAVVAELEQRLTEYLKQQGGLLPQPNPHYDPAGVRSVDSRGGNGGGKKSKPKK